jgi:hypothetical protein
MRLGDDPSSHRLGARYHGPVTTRTGPNVLLPIAAYMSPNGRRYCSVVRRTDTYYNRYGQKYKTLYTLPTRGRGLALMPSRDRPRRPDRVWWLRRN